MEGSQEEARRGQEGPGGGQEEARRGPGGARRGLEGGGLERVKRVAWRVAGRGLRECLEGAWEEARKGPGGTGRGLEGAWRGLGEVQRGPGGTWRGLGGCPGVHPTSCGDLCVPSAEGTTPHIVAGLPCPAGTLLSLLEPKEEATRPQGPLPPAPASAPTRAASVFSPRAPQPMQQSFRELGPLRDGGPRDDGTDARNLP